MPIYRTLDPPISSQLLSSIRLVKQMTEKSLEVVRSSLLKPESDVAATCSTRSVGAIAYYIMMKQSAIEQRLIRISPYPNVCRKQVCIIGSLQILRHQC